MLLYEHEGFIETEAKEIQQLCRSTAAVSFGNADQVNYELQATLCDYQDKDERRCRIAFYVKNLKRALVFSVAGTEKNSLWQYGHKALLDLGYQLDDVNLELSPAMLEVVLRDVPGIASPDEAHRQRAKHQKLLADLQTTCDKNPDSTKGKRAALNLSTEKRLQEQSLALRELLDGLFSPQEYADDETATLLAQVKDLTARLEEAEAEAEAERSQKELNETITTAAEKRIQELEELLVYVETRSSDILKQKRKVIALNRRIKGLDTELIAARDELAEERDNQKQFIDDVKSANGQIVDLKRALKESEDLREEAFAKLGEQESETTQLDKDYREAELRIKVLDKELKRAEQRVDDFDVTLRRAGELQIQLDKTEEQHSSTARSNEILKEELSAAVEKCDSLQERLKEAERLGQAHDAVNNKLRKLDDEYTELAKENERLREGFDQERSIRKRLERGALEDDRRITGLEQSLKRAEAAVEESASLKRGAAPEASAALDQDMDKLILRLDQEVAARETMENELQEAHKMIDSLEKIVRAADEGGLEKNSRKALTEQDDDRAQELEERLRSLEKQLDRTTHVKKSLDKELATAENKLAAQEGSPTEALAEESDTGVIEAAAQVEGEKASKPSKPLPHELRPRPRKGAFFRAEWDLQGLPCSSTAQVFKAWESVFNVQMAIEGYPSQYCMAFMVVLKQEKHKQLYLLYRLKQNKHTLVCVPAKKPKDDVSLQKAIKEGLSFLRKSGFDMDEMSDEHIVSALGAYCL